MKIVLVDSGGANIGSVRYALQRLGVDAELTAERAKIEAADRVILPGVGAAAPAMARLRSAGLVGVLRTLDQPLLGICLGMQLLFESSEEGEVECLGRLPGRIGKLAAGPGVRIPHMGWNRLRLCAPSTPKMPRPPSRSLSFSPPIGSRPRQTMPENPYGDLQSGGEASLLAGIEDGAWAYFVHSYAAPVTAHCIAASDHGQSFAAVVQRGRVMGVQFHPERSAAAGLRLLDNFLRGNFNGAIV